MATFSDSRNCTYVGRKSPRLQIAGNWHVPCDMTQQWFTSSHAKETSLMQRVLIMKHLLLTLAVFGAVAGSASRLIWANHGTPMNGHDQLYNSSYYHSGQPHQTFGRGHSGNYGPIGYGSNGHPRGYGDPSLNKSGYGHQPGGYGHSTPAYSRPSYSHQRRGFGW